MHISDLAFTNHKNIVSLVPSSCGRIFIQWHDRANGCKGEGIEIEHLINLRLDVQEGFVGLIDFYQLDQNGCR